MLTRDDLPECPICCEILEAPILILGCGHETDSEIPVG